MPHGILCLDAVANDSVERTTLASTLGVTTQSAINTQQDHNSALMITVDAKLCEEDSNIDAISCYGRKIATLVARLKVRSVRGSE